MKKHTFRWVLALLLAALLVCGCLTACGSKAQEAAPADEYVSAGEDAGPEVYTAPEYTTVPFEEMSDAEYDEAAMAEALEQLETLCTQPHTEATQGGI